MTVFKINSKRQVTEIKVYNVNFSITFVFFKFKTIDKNNTNIREKLKMKK